MTSIPDLTPKGAARSYFLGYPDRIALIEYPAGADARHRLQHHCNREGRGELIWAPALVERAGGHTVDWPLNGKPTVSPSVGCFDCGLHGFVRDGRWEPA
jgi:Family of unknown function (DUF6527)